MDNAPRRILTFFSALALSLLVGILAIAQNKWFGSGDLVPYTIYSVPFALFLWACSSLFFRVARGWPLWLATSLSLLFGIVVGFIATYTVAIFLGPWFGAMSVPMLKSWCTAAAIFLPVCHLVRVGKTMRSTIAYSTAFVSLGFVLFFSIRLLSSHATGDQHLATAFFRHVPGEQDLEITGAPAWLTQEDRDLLLRSGLTGRLECLRSGGSNSTDWPRAKAFVIFTSKLSDTIRLPQPKHTEILYLQRGNEFVPFPEGTPTFDRAIEFYEDQSGWNFWVEQASGARSGGVIRP